MPARFAVHESPVNKGKPRRPSYWQRMQKALEEVPDDGEQEVSQYVQGRHRWEELQQRIDETTTKWEFMQGRFGRFLPERALKIRDAWQTTLKTILEDRLAAEKLLAQGFHMVKNGDVESLRSLDEILTEVMQFQTLEEQQAYLVGASLWDVEKLLEQLADFLCGVQERYNLLLSEERKELDRSGAFCQQYNENELHQLLLEIRGCSPKFTRDIEDSLELARCASEDPEEVESRSFLLNPLPGPRAVEVVEELQLRHAASKLQNILQWGAGSEEGTKDFMQKALDILTPRYDNVEQVPWMIFRSECSIRSESHGEYEQPVVTWPNEDARLEAAVEGTTIEDQGFAADSEAKVNRAELAVIVEDLSETDLEVDGVSVINDADFFAMKPSVGTWLGLIRHDAAFVAGQEFMNTAQEVPSTAHGEATVKEVPSKTAEEVPATIEDQAPCSELIMPKPDSVLTPCQIERKRSWRPGQGRVRRHLRNAFSAISRTR